jgi:hypothetical protein
MSHCSPPYLDVKLLAAVDSPLNRDRFISADFACAILDFVIVVI